MMSNGNIGRPFIEEFNHWLNLQSEAAEMFGRIEIVEAVTSGERVCLKQLLQVYGKNPIRPNEILNSRVIVV